MRAAVWFGVALAGCGGGGGGEPLVSGSATGEYAGAAFVADTGFAMVYQGDSLIGVGDGGLDCGSVEMPDPPPGTNAAIALPSFDLGTYSNVFVNLYHNVSGFEGSGSNDGTVTITASTADVVEATVSYAYTDTGGRVFSLDGTFAVVRCP